MACYAAIQPYLQVVGNALTLFLKLEPPDTLKVKIVNLIITEKQGKTCRRGLVSDDPQESSQENLHFYGAPAKLDLLSCNQKQKEKKVNRVFFFQHYFGFALVGVAQPSQPRFVPYSLLCSNPALSAIPLVSASRTFVVEKEIIDKRMLNIFRRQLPATFDYSTITTGEITFIPTTLAVIVPSPVIVLTAILCKVKYLRITNGLTSQNSAPDRLMGGIISLLAILSWLDGVLVLITVRGMVSSETSEDKA
uniref:Uncharacterized protein n=1 Tax=Glossina palpalis gambiensis TaxID=67801 RepID=A0A1B0C5P5_9MUSC